MDSEREHKIGLLLGRQYLHLKLYTNNEAMCKRRLKSAAGGGLIVKHLVNVYPGTYKKSILSIFNQLMEFVLLDEIVSWNVVGDSFHHWPPGYGCGG